jgi:hypothetical protein
VAVIINGDDVVFKIMMFLPLVSVTLGNQPSLKAVSELLPSVQGKLELLQKIELESAQSSPECFKRKIVCLLKKATLYGIGVAAMAVIVVLLLRKKIHETPNVSTDMLEAFDKKNGALAQKYEQESDPELDKAILEALRSVAADGDWDRPKSLCSCKANLILDRARVEHSFKRQDEITSLLMSGILPLKNGNNVISVMPDPYKVKLQELLNQYCSEDNQTANVKKTKINTV